MDLQRRSSAMDLCVVHCVEDIAYDPQGDLGGVNDGLLDQQNNWKGGVDEANDHKLDLYLPLPSNKTSVDSQPCGTDPSPGPPAVVVFVHGGGWQRGGRRAWAHFLSEADTNLPMALYCYWRRLYCNIGHTLAARGVPCAVISYPLLRLPFPVCLVVTLSSAVMTMVFCGVVLLPVLSLCYVLRGIAMTDTSPHPHLTSYVIGLVSVSQIVTWMTMCNFRWRYRKLSRVWIIIVTVCLACNLMGEHLSSSTSCCLNILLVQGTIVWIQVTRGGCHTLDDQLRAVAKALCFIHRRAERTREWDPHRMYLMGHSSGAHLATMIALSTSDNGLNVPQLKGILCLSGVYDVSFLRSGWLSRQLYHRPLCGPGGGSTTGHANTSPLECLRQHRCPCWSTKNNQHADHNGWFTDTHPEPLQLPAFLLVTSGWEPGSLASQAAEMAVALAGHNVPVHTVHVGKSHHFSIVADFGQYRLQADEERTLEDVCVCFINGFI